jgi:hypothetical protein
MTLNPTREKPEKMGIQMSFWQMTNVLL